MIRFRPAQQSIKLLRFIHGSKREHLNRSINIERGEATRFISTAGLSGAYALTNPPTHPSEAISIREIHLRQILFKQAT